MIDLICLGIKYRKWKFIRDFYRENYFENKFLKFFVVDFFNKFKILNRKFK